MREKPIQREDGAAEKRLESIDAAELATAAAQVNRSLILIAMARMSAASGAARRSGCLALPSPLFEELCARLLNRQLTIDDTAAWLGVQTANAPRHSGVHRFACILFREFREACRDCAAGKGGK